jgi:ribokinase
MPRILVVGSANVDFAVAAPRLPTPGETVSGGLLLVTQGGKGANQAVAARRLGADVRLIACIGDDDAGRGVREALRREGIETAGLVTAAGAATGTALIVVDREGRNQIAVASGANGCLSVDHVRACDHDVGWAEVVVCQLEIPLPTVAWVLARARRAGATTVLNPAPVPDAAVEVLSLVDYLTPNEGEAARLSGVAVIDDETAAEAGERLRGRGAGTVIVTRGGEGGLACGATGRLPYPARRVEVVDTTAAGDAFNGALAVALAERRALAEALRFAAAAAALACTRRGAQPSLPTRAAVEELLAS